MSKTKKITFNMLSAKIEKNKAVQLQVDWFGDGQIDVRHTLDMEEAMSFVQEVALSCFDTEKAEYMPEIFDFAAKVNMLVCYAGFDAPKDIKKAYRVVYDTDICDRVLGVINQGQFNILLSAAREKIMHMKDAAISTAAYRVNELTNKMNEVMQNSDEMFAKLGDTDFANMIGRLESLSGMESVGRGSSPIVNFRTKSAEAGGVDG